MFKPYALITGASGLLGKLLTRYLTSQGYQTIALKHKRDTACSVQIDTIAQLTSSHINHLELVINLAGAPIAGGYWSKKRKRLLRESRIQQTSTLIASLAKQNITVGHFISASAIGYYGTGSSDKTELDDAGNDFSACLCQDWEYAAHAAEGLCQTLSIIRTGLVLTPKEGYLGPQRLPARLGLGAQFGDGTQGVSWIDYRDWLNAVDHIINQSLSGAYNLTSPNPVSQAEFNRAFCQSLDRPHWLKLPKLLFTPLGEMKDLFVSGQYVKPARLLDAGFEFNYATLSESLLTLEN